MSGEEYDDGDGMSLLAMYRTTLTLVQTGSSITTTQMTMSSRTEEPIIPWRTLMLVCWCACVHVCNSPRGRYLFLKGQA